MCGNYSRAETIWGNTVISFGLAWNSTTSKFLVSLSADLLCLGCLFHFAHCLLLLEDATFPQYPSMVSFEFWTSTIINVGSTVLPH